MSKKAISRIIRIVTGTFGGGTDEHFSLTASLTKFEKFVHFWVLVYRSFVRNRCPIRASALSFTTLLSLIPMLAVAASLSSAFLKTQGEEQIKAFVVQFIEKMVPSSASPDTNDVATAESPGDVPPSTAPVSTNAFTAVAMTNTVTSARGQIVLSKQQAAEQIYGFIHNASSGQLGVFGAIFLIWTTILTLTRVEETFNDIWGVNRGRDWAARIPNYFTTALLVPLLCIGAWVLTNGPRLQKTKDMLGSVPFLETLISQLIPVVMVCFTFALFYKLVPNTKVQIKAALIGGGIAGIAWHSFNMMSIHFASRAVNASKIYGSLALIPLLMVGLYIVWVIVLFGAQVAYAFQNREAYMQERLAENVNQRGREFVALRLMTCVGQHFARGLPAATVPGMSHELGIPSKLIEQVLQTLVAAHLVLEVRTAECGYSPARPLESINCHHVLMAMRATQGQELTTRDEPVRVEVLGEFARIQAAEKVAAASVTMLTLVHRAQARLELAPPTSVAQESPAIIVPLGPEAMGATMGPDFEKKFEASELVGPSPAPPPFETISPAASKKEFPTEEEREFPL